MAMMMLALGAQASCKKENDMKNDTTTFAVHANGHVLRVTTADNSSAEALLALLAKGDIEIAMRDYASMEKVGQLPVTLPRNDRQTATSAGDVILYQGNQFVIYYGTNNWSLTRLGKIEGATREALLEVLGSGSVKVTLSLE